jgi:hypothetical protein
MAQAVGSLPCKCEALSSNPSDTKGKKKRNNRPNSGQQMNQKEARAGILSAGTHQSPWE